MKKILLAVDDTKGSLGILEVLRNQVKQPEEVILIHVQRLLGRSLIGDMLGGAEMSTLREAIKDTEFQEELDQKAEKILVFYKQKLESFGLSKIKMIVRSGNVSEEIIKVANEEQVDLMIMGFDGKNVMDRMITGSVTRHVTRKTNVPVMIAKTNEFLMKPYDVPVGLEDIYNAG